MVMNIYENVLQMVGNTPILKASQLDTGVCELFFKIESTNPGGSIKDRIALSMIKIAEEQGRISPGDTLVEATAGNTGVGLALLRLHLRVLKKLKNECYTLREKVLFKV